MEVALSETEVWVNSHVAKRESRELAENYMYEKLTVRCPADFDPIPVYISGAIRPADDDGHGPFGAFSGIHLNPPAPCRRCERTRDLA